MFIKIPLDYFVTKYFVGGYMSETGLKIFRLNIDGSFDEISYENIKDVFTIVNILAIYLSQKKTMYIWIGSNATQALKIHISNIRVLVKEEFPDFRIIRNFTFEMRDEPYDFFKNLHISKEELYQLIDYQEEVMLPTLKKIDELKIELDKLIELEDYLNAIKNSQKIIELASQVEDQAVISEQQRLINKFKSKNEEKEIKEEILEEFSAVEKDFSNLIESKEFLKAHLLIKDFEKRFNVKYDLSLISEVKALLIREEEIWEKEQLRLVTTLKKLDNDFHIALEKLQVEYAISIMEKSKSLFPNLVNDEIKLQWEGFDAEVQIAREKVKLVENCDQFIKDYEKLKKEFQFDKITSKLTELLKNVKDLKIVDYEKKLHEIQGDVNSTKDEYNKKLAKIAELEKQLETYQHNNLLEKVLENCQEIIDLAKFIKKLKIIEKYSSILSQTKKAIEERRIFEAKQNNLRKELEQLEKETQMHLKQMNLDGVKKLFEKSEIYLAELVDDKIKDLWRKLKGKYSRARDLIQTVGTLTKSGFSALEAKSYKDSLESYTQVISLIQGYSKQIQGDVK
jgi:hypothetical protein